MLLCSIFVRKHISAIVLMREGEVIATSVKRITDSNITDVFYKELLCTFERSLGYVDMYAKDEEVTFEINNNAVKQWFTRGYSKPQYEELFEKAYLRLHSVPIRYRLVVSNLPKANIYAYEDKLDKRVVHKGFDFEEA